MTFARRSLLGLLLAMGLARAVGYFVYAAACLPSPLETFHLEAKMVLLAYRVELGEPLYPAWRTYPHVANFFGPVYFGLVGLLGSFFRADIPALFTIGRALSFGSGLLTTVGLGVVVGRRYGGFAGVSGAVSSLAAAPMFGFSVMVRPDLMAELPGLGGFFLAGSRSRTVRAGGAGLLVLAILTKQTTGVLLLAAVLGWVIEGDRRVGLWLLVGSLAGLMVVVGASTVLLEPNLARSLMGESRTPWDFGSFARTLGRAAQLSPDLLVFPILGLILWTSGATGRREVRPAVLACVLLASSLGLAAKRGADLNYYLSLRAAEALAVGALWRAWSVPGGWGRLIGLALATLLGGASMVPGILFAVSEAQVERAKAAFLAGPYGRDLQRSYRDFFEMAGNTQARILTDSGLIDLYQGSRAAFGDPWLFRLLAETGQVETSVLRDRVDSQYYDLIVTTSELDRPSYDSYEFGLPRPLVERARVRYVRVGSRAGLFLYGRRPSEGSPPRG